MSDGSPLLTVELSLNKNVVNEFEPLRQLIGDLPSSTPVAFEATSRCGMREEPRSVRMKFFTGTDRGSRQRTWRPP